jgi:hypothetical protein
VRAGLVDADWRLRREIIRALVKQIEVTTEQITLVFRIGLQPRGPGPPLNHLPHCLPQLTANARKGRGSTLRAKRAGDFLLHLEYAQILLRLVVVEGNRQIVEEGEHLVLPQQKSFEQIARGGLRQPTALSRSAVVIWGRRIRRQSCAQQRLVTGEEVGARRRWQVDAPTGPGVHGGRLHLAPQRFEVGRPRLLILLFEEGQLAQMMDVAQRMAAGGVDAIAPPAVVDAHALVGGQDADGIQRLTPAVGVDRVVGEVARTRDVRPGERPPRRTPVSS